MTTVRMTGDQARKVRLTRAQKKRLDTMTDAEITAAAKADADNPPLTAREFALIARTRRGGRPRLPDSERKQSLTLRLPPTVIENFRATGPGWQTRMGAVLERQAVRTMKAGSRPSHGSAPRRTAKKGQK
jgi:uncharacterized protein (DUF4415 family)